MKWHEMQVKYINLIDVDLDKALDEQKVLEGHGRYVLVLLPKDSHFVSDSGIVGNRRAAYFKRPTGEQSGLAI